VEHAIGSLVVSQILIAEGASEAERLVAELLDARGIHVFRRVARRVLDDVGVRVLDLDCRNTAGPERLGLVFGVCIGRG
jgi:hypothetical protein